MLKVEGVAVYYGRIQALHEVSLRVEPGEIVAVIGANGAGKSTLLNAISGMVPVRAGSIVFGGKPVTNLGADRIVRLGISQVPERRQIFTSMSVMDNLILGAYHRHRRDGRRAVEGDLEFVLDVFPRLRERAQQTAGTLSGGEQQMLALGRGWMAKPRLLMMDEPSLGLAPLMTREIFRVSGELREHGTTILLVEQNARAALALADRAYVMETGHLEIEGKASELAHDSRVQQAYLGNVDTAASS